MGTQFIELSSSHIEFISQQKLFFVATAAKGGRVNISPKGCDSFRVINSNQAVWLNLTGSGNETAAHVLKSSRMTIMFCAFEGSPQILRLYGSAKPIHSADNQWSDYIGLFPEYIGTRQLFLLNIELVQSSCGMSIPLFSYIRDRDNLSNWAEKKGRDGIAKYWKEKNQKSLDGYDTKILELSDI